jgi:predicted  nucleic acid-binding Zn-ribbon protein
MDAVMETLEAEIVNRVNEAKSETQKVQRELQIARGQIQDLQAENRRLGNAHGRDKEAGIVRVRELEGRLATADAELASLRQVVEDLKTRSEMSERILEEAGGQPVGAFHRMQEASDALRRDLETVQAERTALSQEVARLRGEVSTLRRRLHDAGRQIESLGGMTNNVRNESGEDVLRRERTLAVLAGAPSLEQGLLFLQENFGDRLTVLNSALASARQADSDGFLYAPRAFDMMKALVTEYWEALVAGHGDTKAKDIFGRDGYASRESDTGEGNERMRRDRTFVWKGTPIYMGKHLRIGVKADLKETWRLHFHWDPSERRIVIGHCGHHLWKLGF